LTFLYLKESLRIISRYLADQDHSITPRGVCLRLDHHGLPTIVPLSLRKILYNKDLIKDRRAIVCILTVLSMFRVFPTSPKVNLDTIVSPFTGLTKSIDLDLIKSALKDLHIRTLKVSKPKLLKLETAGPNSTKSS
jgi:hypothetical protein